MTTEDRIREVLPGASIHHSKHGLEVGAFNMPPVRAQALLRAAGLTVRCVWGATVVKP